MAAAIPAFFASPISPARTSQRLHGRGSGVDHARDRVATCVSNQRNMGKADRGLRAPEHVHNDGEAHLDPVNETFGAERTSTASGRRER